MQDLSSKYDRYAMTKVLVFSSPNILSLGLSEFLLAQENFYVRHVLRQKRQTLALFSSNKFTLFVLRLQKKPSLMKG